MSEYNKIYLDSHNHLWVSIDACDIYLVPVFSNIDNSYTDLYLTYDRNITPPSEYDRVYNIEINNNKYYFYMRYNISSSRYEFISSDPDSINFTLTENSLILVLQEII